MNNDKFKDRSVMRDDRKDDDVKLIGSRLYVGNLSEKITKEVIENRFSKYGRIIGVALHRDHCFVQFEDESAVGTAVKAEHESIMFGNKLEVRCETDIPRESQGVRDDKSRFVSSSRRRSPSLDNRRDRRDRMREEPPPQYRQSYRDRSPLAPRGGRDNIEGVFRRDDARPPPPPPNRADDRFRPGDVNPRGIGARDSFEAPERDRPDNPAMFSRRPPESQDLPLQYKVRDSLENYVDYVTPSKPNDCEIIVLNKMQRGYAEQVERKLRSASLVVDILFPKEESRILNLLNDISARGCLYAIVILPQNEIHKSITVNILYGTPQEHRNMPLDDAISFVARNFNMYMNEKGNRRPLIAETRKPLSAMGEGGGGAPYGDPPQRQQQPMGVGRGSISYADPQRQQQAGGGPSYVDPQRHQPVSGGGGGAGPFREATQQQQHHHQQPVGDDASALLRLLANGKQLTVGEINRVIKHLEENRDRMMAAADSKDNNYSVAQQQQADLQQKIYNLFGGGPANSGGGNNNSMASANPNMAMLGGGRDVSMGGGGGGGFDDSRGGGSRAGGGEGVSRRKGGEGRWGPPVGGAHNAASPPSSSLNINLDNPNIQKALNSLLQSGPNILKNLDAPDGAGSLGGGSGYPGKSGGGMADQRYLGGGPHREQPEGRTADSDGRRMVGGGREPRGMDVMESDHRHVDQRQLGRESRHADVDGRYAGRCMDRDTHGMDLDARHMGRDASRGNVDQDVRGPGGMDVGTRGVGRDIRGGPVDLESPHTMGRDSRNMGPVPRGMDHDGRSIGQDVPGSMGHDSRNLGPNAGNMRSSDSHRRDLDSRAMGMDARGGGSGRDLEMRRMGQQQQAQGDRYGRGPEQGGPRGRNVGQEPIGQDLVSMGMDPRIMAPDAYGMGGPGGYSMPGRPFQGAPHMQGPYPPRAYF